MESGRVLRGVRVDPQRGSAELSGGQLPLAGVKPPDPPSNTALVRIQTCVFYASTGYKPPEAFCFRAGFIGTVRCGRASSLWFSRRRVSETHGSKVLKSKMFRSQIDPDLDLDSARVHVDALNHTLTPASSVNGRCLCLFPRESKSFITFLTAPFQFVLCRPGPLLNLGTL